MKIFYDTVFERQFKKLERSVQKQAIEREVIFRADPFTRSLRTHKLKGFWAFWVNHRDRVIFDFKDEGIVRFYSIGDHDIYN